MSKQEYKFSIVNKLLQSLNQNFEKNYEEAREKEFKYTTMIADAINNIKREFIQKYMDDPIDTAICASIMFHTVTTMEAIQVHHKIFSTVNFCSLIGKSIAKTTGNPFADSTPIRTGLIKLYTFFPEDYTLSEFDDPDTKELESIFNKFKSEEKASIRKKIEGLVPNLLDQDYEKLETFIQEARKKTIEHFSLYFAHANALQDLLKHHCITTTEFYKRKNNIKNALADKYLQSASEEKELKIQAAIAIEAKYIQEFEASYDKTHPRTGYESILDIQKKSKEREAWRCEKIIKVEESKDPWEFNTFTRKFQSLHSANKTYVIFLTLCEACKRDERLPHVRFILNCLNQENKDLLLNKNTTLLGQDTLTPFQCAVQANATEVANLLLNKYKLNHSNLEKALTLTNSNKKLALKINVAIKEIETATHVKEKDNSPPSTSFLTDILSKKITANDLHKELEKLTVKQKEIKSWISPYQFQISLKEDTFDKQSHQNLKNYFVQQESDFDKLQIDIDAIKKQLPDDETKAVAENLVILSKNIEELTKQQVKIYKNLAEIPNKIKEIEKQIQQAMLPPINPSKKFKEIKAKQEPQKKQKDQGKIEVKNSVNIDTDTPQKKEVKEVEDKKIQLSIYNPQLSIWEPLPKKPQEKTPTKLEDKDARCQLLKAYCEFKPKNPAEKLVLYNAILFRVQQYMVIQSTPDLPPQYLEGIGKQLSIRTVKMMRHALVHSYSLLQVVDDLKEVKEVKEVINFASTLVECIETQQFNKLTQCQFYSRLMSCGEQLMQHYDDIPSDEEAIKHVLFINTQRLSIMQLSMTSEKDEKDLFTNTMREDAAKMWKIRLNKYVPESREARQEANDLVHLMPQEEMDLQARQNLITQKIESWRPPTFGF